MALFSWYNNESNSDPIQPEQSSSYQSVSPAQSMWPTARVDNPKPLVIKKVSVSDKQSSLPSKVFITSST